MTIRLAGNRQQVGIGSWISLDSVRILHILTQKPGFTGSGIYLRALLKQAQELGDETAVVFGCQDEDPKAPFERSFPVHFDSPALPFPITGMSDVMPYRSTIWSAVTPSMLKAYEKQFELVISGAVRDFQPDVVHCHHLWVLAALVRRKFPDLRVVASCHGTGLRQHSLVPELGRVLVQDLQKLDHIYCLTPAQMQSCEIFGSSRSLVGAGFDTEIFHAENLPVRRKGRVIYAGKLSRSKGLNELLEAYQGCGSAFPLALAGSGHGEEAEFIERKAKALGVDLLGRLTQEELAEEMRSSELFVLPSYYEGLPLVLAEALACGCRLLVNDLPGLRDWLEAELLSSAWVELLEMPRLVSADQPEGASIPDYVERLQKSLLTGSTAELRTPRILSTFLKRNSWSGVYQKIRRHYAPGGSD